MIGNGITRRRSGAVEGEGEEGLGEAVGVVAQEVVFEGEVAGDGFYAEGADAVEVGCDGGLASAGVLFQQGGGDGRGVDEGVVEDARPVVAQCWRILSMCWEAVRPSDSLAWVMRLPM